MNRHEIKINDKEYTLPKDWNSCTFHELAVIAEAWGMMLMSTDDITEEDVLRRMMIILRDFMKLPQEQLQSFSAQEMHALIGCVKWITTSPIDFNSQPPDKIKVFHKNYYGPTKGLTTSSFDEFIFADTAFLDFAQNQNYSALYLLAATLYRPRRKDLNRFKQSDEYNGDFREPFNPVKVRKHAKRLELYLDLYKAMAIMYFYWGFRETNLLKFEILFDDKDDQEKESEKETKSKNTAGWVNTRLAISGDKFGDFKNTGKTNWRTIMWELSVRAKQQYDEEQRIKQMQINNKLK